MTIATSTHASKEVKVSLSNIEIKDNQERHSSQMDLKLIG